MKKFKNGHVWLLMLLKLLEGVSASWDDSTSRCYGMSRGTDFTVGFTANVGQDIESRRLSILVAGGHEDAEVSVSSKHQVNGRPLKRTAVVKARGFQRFDIPADYMMNDAERRMKGIRVSASSDVSVYGLSSQKHSTDRFLGIPTNNLGKQYVVVTPSGDSAPQPSLFAVIGTEDSTEVMITLCTAQSVTIRSKTYNGTYVNGQVLTYTLNDLESVQIESPNGGVLTGTLIQSSKPVAVFSGNRCADFGGSACDTLTEQLVPVKSWGQKHVYTAFRQSDENVYYIVAYFDDTKVSIPGVADQMLNAGDFWEGQLSGSGLVSSSHPTLMMQLLVTIDGARVDPSLIQIPSEEQFGTTFAFTTPAQSAEDPHGFHNFINVVVKQGSHHTVHINGKPITSEYQVKMADIPNTEYTLITSRLPKGEAFYFIEQTDPTGHPLSVIAYGYEKWESYGYAAGLALPSNRKLVNLSPYYFREVGGEVLTVTVSCGDSINIARIENAKCKFTTGIGEVIVPADRVNLFTVNCEAPYFYQSGLATVQVSLDDGKTFPFSGNIYVASQDDLPPLLEVRQRYWETRGRVIDVQSEDLIEFSWNLDLIGSNTSLVDLMIETLYTDSNGVAVLRNKTITIMKETTNYGYFTILPTVVRASLDAEFVHCENGSTPLVVFSLVRSEEVRGRHSKGRVIIRSGLHIISNYVDECESYKDLLSNTAKDPRPCPCTYNQAMSNRNFQLSNDDLCVFHSGAVNCFRTTTAAADGSGQQCCYADNGIILVGHPGGGTIDRFTPGDHFWLHQTYDVLPWLACCQLSNKCDVYYKYRPSDDCRRYNPPRPARGRGDPHITTLDGKEFTFNGAGEFLMISSAMHDLVFQARTEAFRDTKATVYTGFAIETSESVKIQVERSENKTVIAVNGEPLHLASSPIKARRFQGVKLCASTDLSLIRIVFEAGIALDIYTKSDMMSFIVQLNDKFNGQVRGLLGNFNGNPEDDLQLPNGTVMKGSYFLKEIHTYGMNWVVEKDDSIFTYSSPYDHSTYYQPDFTPNFDIPLDKVSEEVKKLCGESSECIFDAVTTGSLSFANETLRVSATFDSIQNNSVKIVSCGFPGTVDNGQITGRVYLVNATLDIACEDGFILEGSPRVTCNRDGRWSTDLPQCVLNTTKIRASIFAIAIGVLVVVIIKWFGFV